MPGRDGTGPVGMGMGTGRRFGPCFGGANIGYGYGLGFGGRGRGARMGRGFGFGRGMGYGMGYGMSPQAVPVVTRTQQELLTEQKEFLQERLAEIEALLEEK